MSWFSLSLPLAQVAQSLTTTETGMVPPVPPTPLEGGLWMLAIIFVVFVLPFVLSRYLAKSMKMPTYSSSMGTIIAAIVGGLVVIALGTLRYGPDILGGTNLVYELDKRAMSEQQRDGLRITAKDLIQPLRERLNPAGTKEILIRPRGDDQIEIIVPNVDPLEIKDIKRVMSEAGILEFRIVANTNDHPDVIAVAREQANLPTEINRMNREVSDGNGKVVGMWRIIGRDQEFREGIQPLKTAVTSANLARDASTGRLLPPYSGGQNEEHGFEKFLSRQGIPQIELLIALERGGEMFPEVTGSDISNSRVDIANNGGYEVQFSMRTQGAAKLLKLTVRNQPDPKTDFHRRMAILLDGRILSAPQLNQPISNQGVITGGFTNDEANFLVKILQSGSLPTALNKEPISENQVGAAMGQDAIVKGFVAAIAALICTALFMLIYYRFSGLVACVALGINLLLILAAMIIIQQPITLPGLAGLVLSVGMSVDANVLVFERIREEIAKNSTPRLAIRNGFDRAFSTIVDSNLTTLISAIVLYWVGTDQVRGFAITLIIGIVISMFTAVFCSRVIFEICERRRLVGFKMMDIVATMRNGFMGARDVDFMSIRKVCYAISAIAMLVGVITPILRGRQLLDIDFNGGTTVTFVLDKQMPADDVRALTNQIFAEDSNSLPIDKTLTNVRMEPFAADTVYRLDTSLKDINEVTKRLVNGFEKNPDGAQLVTYKVDANVKPSADEQGSNRPTLRRSTGLHYVSMLQEPDTTEDSGVSPRDETATMPVEPAMPNQVLGEITEEEPSFAAPIRSSIEFDFKAADLSEAARINASVLVEKLIEAAGKVGFNLTENQIQVQPKESQNWNPSSDVGYPQWIARMPLDSAQAQQVIDQFKTTLSQEPIWQSVSKIDSRVAEEMQTSAISALVIAMMCIVAYIWFRFQKISYGLAALVALVHDVLITLGFVAISHWLFRPLGFLLVDDFKISLNMVAAFLTIIGYSLNDTIVVFDRIREVKGKAPRLTREMINRSINQTLGRTLLTSTTTLIAVLLLYIFGGEAVHAFSYALLVGIVVGTYSSIFVAAPILLWFSDREEKRNVLRTA